MKLSKLQISGYRGIGSLQIKFDDHMTILIGKNGIGKSTILDAVASLLTPVQKAWPDDNDYSEIADATISAKEVKDGWTEATIDLSLMPDQPMSKREIRLTSKFRGGKNEMAPSSILEFWNFAREGGLANEVRTLMVYYRQDRGFEQNSRSSGGFGVREVMDSSLAADIQAISHLQEWWDKRDAQEARRVRDRDADYRDPQLEAIRNIIKEIDGFSELEYSSTKNPEGIYFIKTNGTSVHVNMLSSGERSFIILLADLSRRLQVLNPNVELGKIPGIILIDEVELNLHPAWQSKVIETLSRAFSSCQFVITTHSPQVISSVESDHVFSLETNDYGNIKVTKPLRTKGQTSNYLLEGVFKASERFPEIDAMMEAFNDLVSYRRLTEAEAMYRRVVDEIEGDPPELLLMEKRLRKLRESL